MAQNKMLIDATHPEETRVVVVRGNKVEEFDFESQNKQPIKGNIYLAKITRVEPSLQAAFVEYGGNRHGFLAFSEIHPDYYQIPVADREALLAEEAEAARREEEDEDETPKAKTFGKRRRKRGRDAKPLNATATDEVVSEEAPQDGEEATEEPITEAEQAAEELEIQEQEKEEQVEQLGEADSVEDSRSSRMTPLRRRYKIQEVIRRNQVVLIQVVKEERGNKGAAVTTYMSLAGRYAVLMPNTARGGGISRKITQGTDRKRLKEVVGDLDVPQGMGVILRTAGANRTAPEIKRDFEYLMRVWETIRDLTLSSHAPQLVHEEGSLIKRSLRDLYGKEVDEVWVAGDAGYAEAHEFMKMLMPTHAKNIQHYSESAPLFARFGVEAQLDAMFSHTVTLKSGGYIVLNQTEALVAIDVNSGRATKEHHIEDTAVKTNLEAADEVARQLRLRDLAGLVVVDFIDMEEFRNNKAVEKRLKDALKNDRARIQVGRISHFGLLEMSRQRLRSGVLESSSERCTHCQGSGFVRSKASVALHILRALEEHLLKFPMHNVILTTRQDVALYILNVKRSHIAEIEARFKVSISVSVGETDGSHLFKIERGEQVQTADTAFRPVMAKPKFETVINHEDEAEDEAAEDTAGSAEANEKKRNRRRRKRKNNRGGDEARGNDENTVANDSDEPSDDIIIYDPEAPIATPVEAVVEAEKPARRPRRDRAKKVETTEVATETAPQDAPSEATEEGEQPRRGLRRGKFGRVDRRGRRDKPADGNSNEGATDEAVAFAPEVVAAPVVVAAPAPVAVVETAVVEEAPRRRRTPDPEPVVEVAVDADAPKKRGWWSK